MKVVYTKVGVDDVEVKLLAETMKEKPQVVATLINQQRYRKAYNKLNLDKMKVVRKLLREHPELVG